MDPTINDPMHFRILIAHKNANKPIVSRSKINNYHTDIYLFPPPSPPPAALDSSSISGILPMPLAVNPVDTVPTFPCLHISVFLKNFACR